MLYCGRVPGGLNPREGRDGGGALTTGIHQIIERQIKGWQLEAEMREQASDQKPPRQLPLRPFVAISRAFGSGGGEIARRLAENLGYQIFDREIVDVLVEEDRFRRAILDSLDERDRSSFEIWVDGLLRGSLVDKGEYLRVLIGVLGSIAMHGHAVILGRGGNFLLDPGRGLSVRIVAPMDQRIETISRLRSLPYEEAEKIVVRTDADRSAFIRRQFQREIDDPLAYDLEVNTAGIGVEAAVALIEQALRKKLGNRPHVQF
ncbi:MAG: hypothetical protein GF346_04105 [Candidatus Eisenbacteria bacterium]|nr:hypothetical protein [Candidatus Latescibacterota bacterium]MBD3301609.1 hypothetical protein [Candidatus Eisenbacteria bacterium]